MKPKALQMLIPEGNLIGMKVIELAGWSGKCKESDYETNLYFNSK